MKASSITLILLGLCFHQTNAVLWYFLRWYTPSSSAEFIEVLPLTLLLLCD